jgi:hypothetical protein
MPVLTSWGLAKGWLRGPCEMYGRGLYTDRAWKVCGVLIRISSTWCTSIRIAMTLRYEEPLVCGCQYVVNL